MQLSHRIDNADLVEFMLLPDEVRREVQSWQRALATVAKPIQHSLEKIAARMGVSYQTARRKYDAWRKAHDWRALINRAKVPDGRGLPPEFLAYWKSLCGNNTRSHKAAYREFVRQFKAGEIIPGIEPGISRQTLPTGFTYDNLMLHKPTKFERTATSIGRSAAADFRPLIFTDRSKLSVGQFVMFDDMWHDFEVVRIGQKKPMRLLQLHAHDVFSACQFARGMKPRLRDELTGKSVQLNESEMWFLVCHVLGTVGYRRLGTTFLVEHGTAAISEALEKLLFDLSGGLIRVERSGMEGASAFAGQYAGRGKGNFRFKASLESLGNLIHNETANVLEFPGQTGSNSRINCPEELAGREKHAIALELALLALPAKMRDQLRLPFLEVNQAMWLVGEVMERINQRTEHELQGWLDCGHSVVDFFLPGVGLIPAANYLALDAAKRAAVDAVAAPAPRLLSPREVFNAGSKDLIKFRPEQCAALLADRTGVEVSVDEDHLIRFEDENISPNELRYLAHHFAPGDKFRAVVNPCSPETLHLFGARGQWIGVVKTWQTIDKADTEALHRQMGAAGKVLGELLKPVAAQGAALTRKRLEDAQHNTAKLRRPDLTEDEKTLAAMVKKDGVAGAEAILDNPRAETPAEAPPETDASDDFLNAISNRE